jgi:hypothetical protein
VVVPGWSLKAFGCVPYFAIVVDAENLIRVFIVSLKHLVSLFPPTKMSVGWKMTLGHVSKYYSDPHIRIFEMRTDTVRWWKGIELSNFGRSTPSATFRPELIRRR